MWQTSHLSRRASLMLIEPGWRCRQPEHQRPRLSPGSWYTGLLGQAASPSQREECVPWQAAAAASTTYNTQHGGGGGGGLAFLPAFSDLQSSQKCLPDRFASGCDFAQVTHQRLRCPFKSSPQFAAFNLLVHGDQQVVT